MAGLLGIFVGSALAVTLLGLMLGLMWKSAAPGARALYATLAAWIVAGVLAGFGFANGGPYRWDAIIVYLPGAIAAFFYLRWHYGKMWIEDEA